MLWGPQSTSPPLRTRAATPHLGLGARAQCGKSGAASSEGTHPEPLNVPPAWDSSRCCPCCSLTRQQCTWTQRATQPTRDAITSGPAFMGPLPMSGNRACCRPLVNLIPSCPEPTTSLTLDWDFSHSHTALSSPLSPWPCVPPAAATISLRLCDTALSAPPHPSHLLGALGLVLLAGPRQPGLG